MASGFSVQRMKLRAFDLSERTTRVGRRSAKNAASSAMASPAVGTRRAEQPSIRFSGMPKSSTAMPPSRSRSMPTASRSQGRVRETRSA